MRRARLIQLARSQQLRRLPRRLRKSPQVLGHRSRNNNDVELETEDQVVGHLYGTGQEPAPTCPSITLAGAKKAQPAGFLWGNRAPLADHPGSAAHRSHRAGRRRNHPYDQGAKHRGSFQNTLLHVSSMTTRRALSPPFDPLRAFFVSPMSAGRREAEARFPAFTNAPLRSPDMCRSPFLQRAVWRRAFWSDVG